MIVQSAAKAKEMLTGTLYRRHDPIEVALLDGTVDRVLTVWCRAPLEILLVINVSPHQQRLISLLEIIGDKKTQGLRIHNHTAAIPGTFYPRSFSLLADFLREIMSIAVNAEAMSTAHSICLQIVATLTANVTHEPWYNLCLRCHIKIRPKPSFLECLLRMIHVGLYELLPVPSPKP
jgi:hypothetical protein